jgi:hypothetical protein
MPEAYLQSSRIGLALELTSPNRRRAGASVLFLLGVALFEPRTSKHALNML